MSVENYTIQAEPENIALDVRRNDREETMVTISISGPDGYTVLTLENGIDLAYKLLKMFGVEH